MEPIRFAIIGTGQVASRHLGPALCKIEHARLCGVLSRSHTRGEAFLKGLSVQGRVYTKLDTLAQDPSIDAVIIASPDALHAAQAITLMNSGKHVFVEKPMATNEHDALAMLSTRSAAGVRLQVGYHLRYHAGHQWLRQQIASGNLGQLHRISMNWTYQMNPEDSPWRARGELGRWWVLSALGTHLIDLATWLITGDESGCPEIKILSSNAIYHQRDEQALISMAFTDGPLVDMFVSGITRKPRTISVQSKTTEILCTETLGARGAGVITLNGNPVEFQTVDPYEQELRAFTRAIETNSPCVPGALIGLRNTRRLETATSWRTP